MSAVELAGLSLVVSAIAAFLAIRTHSQMRAYKSLDLRLKLGATYNEFNVLRRDISGTMDRGFMSRQRVINVQNPGGAQIAWTQEHDQDVALMNSTIDRVPVDTGSYQKFSEIELENLIHTVEGALFDLRKLESKYIGVMAADDAFRNARTPRVSG